MERLVKQYLDMMRERQINELLDKDTSYTITRMNLIKVTVRQLGNEAVKEFNQKVIESF